MNSVTHNVTENRHPGNPIITPHQIIPSRSDLEVVGVFNPGVARQGTEVVLLLRVAERAREREPGWVVAPTFDEGTGEIKLLRVRPTELDAEPDDPRLFRYRGTTYLTTISHFRCARSEDGYMFRVDAEPAMTPTRVTEVFGIEDPRITRIEGTYWIAYKAVSAHGATTALARTDDFIHFERLGDVFCPGVTNAVIFPKRLQGDYLAWIRPSPGDFGVPGLWLSRSPDLRHWGGLEPFMLPRPEAWDAWRIGTGCVPFETPAGWLALYHAVDQRGRYGLGACVVDSADPKSVLARSTTPLLVPETIYEQEGFYGSVVYSCGADVRPNGCVMVYYGAADTSTCLFTTTVPKLLASLGV